MVDHIWVVIVSIGFLFLIIGFLVGLGILVYGVIQIKKSMNKMNDFIEKFEKDINPMLQTTDATLKTIKSISEDIGHITANARNLSNSLNDLATNAKEVSIAIKTLQDALTVRVIGLRSGFKTALEVLLKQKV
ncbi:MAG: DUF948 domain-containing protein [Thermodesulfovibrionales bacterium]|nr:DUF948 domain-containing protein [Thermodesulfovibrionales bacterium]